MLTLSFLLPLFLIIDNGLSAVTVNVGRAGAASLDVIQEVEYVKQEAKIIYLLECLQKTPPPVRPFLCCTCAYFHRPHHMMCSVVSLL